MKNSIFPFPIFIVSVFFRGFFLRPCSALFALKDGRHAECILKEPNNWKYMLDWRNSIYLLNTNKHCREFHCWRLRVCHVTPTSGFLTNIFIQVEWYRFLMQFDGIGPKYLANKKNHIFSLRNIRWGLQTYPEQYW